ncbi:MAG: glycoside hydrolase family 6 protein [Thermoleophilaceae bacterium]|nr:glycoside hydrolase family 6 protein [Thermoleophilaceae bacterium]
MLRYRPLLSLSVLVLSLALAPAADAQVSLPPLPPLPPLPGLPQLPTPPPVPTPPQDPRGVDPSSPNPLIGRRWVLDRQWGVAWRAARHLRSSGRSGDAQLVERIAVNPVFKKFGKYDRSPADAVRKYIQRARQAEPGATPQIQIMRHEGEECHPRYLAGGVAADNSYKRWLDGLADGIGNSRVVIAYEPDSVGTVDCLAPHRRAARYRMLAWGVDRVSQLPNATVYIEGGACDWKPASMIAKRLRKIGIHKVRGFMVNATHYASTRCNLNYGRQLSRMVGGKHFIINTSENGNGGQYFYARTSQGRRRNTVWCNPTNTKMGPRPTTNTGDPLADAFVYIGRPGFSSGRCNGGPQTGSWWLERALTLARRG